MREILTNPEIARKVEWPMIIFGSLISFISGLSVSDWGVICGIVIGLAGLFMKWREHSLTILKTNEEINEIKKRVVFMDRAGLSPMNYHTPSPELEAMKDPSGEQAA
jgi:hypothetical protein